MPEDGYSIPTVVDPLNATRPLSPPVLDDLIRSACLSTSGECRIVGREALKSDAVACRAIRVAAGWGYQVRRQELPALLRAICVRLDQRGSLGLCAAASYRRKPLGNDIGVGSGGEDAAASGAPSDREGRDRAQRVAHHLPPVSRESSVRYAQSRVISGRIETSAQPAPRSRKVAGYQLIIADALGIPATAAVSYGP